MVVIRYRPAFSIAEQRRDSTADRYFGERQHMDRKNVESIEKVRSKSPFLDAGGQVSIRRGDGGGRFASGNNY